MEAPETEARKRRLSSVGGGGTDRKGKKPRAEYQMSTVSMAGSDGGRVSSAAASPSGTWTVALGLGEGGGGELTTAVGSTTSPKYDWKVTLERLKEELREKKRTPTPAEWKAVCDKYAQRERLHQYRTVEILMKKGEPVRET